MGISTKYRTCNLCEALCGLEIELIDGQVSKIRGDKKDPFSKGHLCPKAYALKDIHEDPDRLKFPLKKVNGDWVQIDWQEAFDYVGERIHAIQQGHGTDAVGIYQGNPSVHNLGTSLFSPNFVRALKTKNRFSATSVDQLGHHLAAEFMFGHLNLIPVPDIDHTDFWVIMGGNPIISNGSLMTAPDVSGRLKAIQNRGGKVVVIDPRRTETAQKADQHIFIKPGSDIYLVLYMIRYAFEHHHINLGHLESVISQEQISQIDTLTVGFACDETSTRTGISQEDLVQLAHEYCTATKAVWYGRLGVSANKYGGLCHWAINTLNILTGHFDTSGGAMLTSAAIDVANRKSETKKFNRWQSRVKKLPETGGELPSGTIADEILTPGEGQIRAMITSCGNPVLSVPNGRKLDEALASLDFMVSIDIYLNETTRHADIILPPATGLETPHYGLGFHNLAVRNTAKYSEPAIEKQDGTKFDYEIFLGLQKALEKLTQSPEDQIKNEQYFKLNPEIMLDMMLRGGKSGLTLNDLKNQPHGIDLGPLQKVFPDKLLTDNSKIDILPEIYIVQLQSLLSNDNGRAEEFLLIGRRHLRSNNSWLHNSHRMVKGGDRCTVLIHPDDACSKGIVDGQWVEVYSNVGRVKLKSEITDEMMPGTISIPHGWGHNREGTRMKIAEEHAGVSMNDLIDDSLMDELSGVSIISGIPVGIDVM